MHVCFADLMYRYFKTINLDCKNVVSVYPPVIYIHNDRPPIDQFQYIKIRPETIDLSMRLWGINKEFVGFIPQGLLLRSIVLG